MNTFIYRGKKIAISEINNSISKLAKTLNEDISNDKKINYKNLISSLSVFSNSIKEGNIINKKSYNQYSLKELADNLEENLLNKKIIQALNDYPGELKNVNPSINMFSGYIPIGVIGHLFLSDNIVTSFLSVIDSIIAGNINIIICESNLLQIYSSLLDELINIEPKLSNYVYLYPLNKISNTNLTTIINACNSVELQGPYEKIKEVDSLIPSTINKIYFNDKINLSYITKKGENKETYKNLAVDYFDNNIVVNNVPKIIYYECDTKKELVSFSEKIVQAIKKLDNKGYKEINSNYSYPISLVDISKKNKTFVEIPNSSFKIILDLDSTLNTVNDVNTVIIKSIKRKDLNKVFTPFSLYLGTVALAASTDEIFNLTNFFSSNGVEKITNCGGIINNNNCNISNYVKKFSIEQSILPKGIYNFNELDKNSFTNEADIPFKDIESNTANAFSLLASGLNLEKDLCANIIPTENILEKFLIHYEILNSINANQIYLKEDENPYFIAEKIINNNANVIIGSSSYILKLLNSNKDWFKWYGKINKIFYYDENLLLSEIEYLKNEFNIEIVKSVSFSSTSDGILGISCPFCDNNTYHVNVSCNSLEIFKFNEDVPVGKNEEGRLVWKYRNPTTKDIITYDSGELGIWVNRPCKCGRTTPRFNIVGKKGDLFKIDHLYINYNSIKKVLSSTINYNGLLQINLETIDNRTNMTILVENYVNVDDCYSTLYENYPEYTKLIDESLTDVVIINMYPSEFTYNTKNASIINVIDARK